jgi:hypothetical protein
VTSAAVRSGQAFRNNKAVVVRSLLTCRRLVAFQTAHVFLRVNAQFELMNHAVLKPVVALGALAGGPDQSSARLRRLGTWSGAVHQKSTDDQGET